MAYRTPETWNALSDAYRERLARKGITREIYLDKSQSLTGARGHGKTPEHPERAIRNPSRYPEYVAKRADRTKQLPSFDVVMRHVRKMFIDALNDGVIKRVDLHAVEQHVKALTPGRQARLLTMDIQEWRERASSKHEREGWEITLPDGERRNAFFYH